MNNRELIRSTFLAHGFTVKPGETDLKEYVFNAGAALLKKAPRPSLVQIVSHGKGKADRKDMLKVAVKIRAFFKDAVVSVYKPATIVISCFSEDEDDIRRIIEGKPVYRLVGEGPDSRVYKIHKTGGCTSWPVEHREPRSGVFGYLEVAEFMKTATDMLKENNP